MRKTFFLLTMMLTIASISAQSRLTIEISGIEETKGKLMVAVFNEVNFIQNPSFAKMENADNKTIAVVFDGVPDGEYAVTLFQDLNENYRLDLGEYDIPTEPYGFSRNFVPRSKPTFADCAFKAEGDTKVKIKLQRQ
jgi:uncharacterized protein (DUF2141 family)